MLSRFFRRRPIWWPTLTGWAGLLVLLGAPFLLWWLQGESFLSLTERQPAEVLVVEGWIGRDGLEAAKVEFDQGGYLYLVTSGGLSKNDWDHHRWNYAQEAGGLLVRLGVPAEKVIEAPALDTNNQRTFTSALAARLALAARKLNPTAVNVFTVGVHARRSRLIFAKALAPGTNVGVIAWLPPDYHRLEPWWKSSERAEDFIKETVGYFFELLLNSGRWSNSPPESARNEAGRKD